MVVAWTLTADPSDKYLECNGQAVDADKYPKLYALMHNTPDYRGVFLRGLGSITYSQINGSLNGVTATTYSSGKLGDIQGDAIQKIWGSLPVNDNGGFPASTGGFYYSYGFRYGPQDEWDKEGGVYFFDSSRIVSTSNENRPINKAVRYFIKAR